VTDALGHSRGWSIVLGILLILAGLFAIAVPFVAGIAASIFIGWLILFAGVVHLVYAWAERGAGAVVWQILIGLVYLFAAFYIFTHPVGGILALTMVLAAYIAVEGVFELLLFARLRRLPGTIWFLVDGLLSLFVAGLIGFQWPWSSAWAIGILVGVSLLMSGIARLAGPARPRTLLEV
jgi:uncharacterized membrane protein HdeD (DUF308 family)